MPRRLIRKTNLGSAGMQFLNTRLATPRIPTLSRVEYIPLMKNCLPFLSKNLLPTASMVGSLAATAALLRTAAAARSEERMLTDMGSANRKEKAMSNFCHLFPSFANAAEECNCKKLLPFFPAQIECLFFAKCPKPRKYKLLLRAQVCGGNGSSSGSTASSF